MSTTMKQYQQLEARIRKSDLDAQETRWEFGRKLLGEQVEKVNPDLVARDEEGKPYTVRYEAVNAMLLNEFLKAQPGPD